MPVTLDTYNKCSYNCLYCFSYFQKSHSIDTNYQQSELTWVNPKNFGPLLSLEPDCSLKQFLPYVADGKVIQYGGLADQFDEYERRRGVTLEVLKVFKKFNYPLCFSTKAVWWIYDERYRELFRDQANWNTKISIINLDETLAGKIEKGCPTPAARIEAIRELVKVNPRGGVTLRLRPFIIGMTDRNNEHIEILRQAKAAGADAVSTEFFCLEARANEDLLKRYARMSEALGYDIYEFYRRHSHGSGYRRLNYNLKKKYFDELETECKRLGLRFYVSDAHHKERCHNGSCCGLGSQWNYSRGQFTEALCIAKERGKVRFGDIEKDMEMFKNIHWIRAAGFNTGSTELKAKRQNQTLYDYIREVWNTPNSLKSPYKYFGGMLKPVGLDDQSNVIYEYNYDKNEK
jgi:DNA repair photolyase